MRTVIPALAAIGLTAGPAFAHGAAEGAAVDGGNLAIVAALLAIAAVYVAGRRAARRHRTGPVAGQREPAAFAGAVAALALALLPPLDRWAEALFSAHMVQHLLLMLVAAPLLAAARPWLTALWALPLLARRRAGRVFAGAAGRWLAVFTTAPLAAWTWFSGLFVFWHLPGPYAAALSDPVLHALEHASFLASGCAFWWIVVAPRGAARLDYGGRLIFVASAAILSSLPGALMVLTQRAFYPVHEAGAARFGLTALEDQHLAGLVMWIPAGFAYLCAVSALFVLWLRDAEARQVRRALRPDALLCLFALAVLLPGCREVSELGAVATAPAQAFGDPQAGARLIAEAGCGGCHLIPGIVGAKGLVGPPLTQMGRRIYIAGILRNTPDNLVTWVMNPQSVVPGNAMPDMGLDEQQARDIAAYLYTLR